MPAISPKTPVISQKTPVISQKTPVISQKNNRISCKTAKIPTRQTKDVHSLQTGNCKVYMESHEIGRNRERITEPSAWRQSPPLGGASCGTQPNPKREGGRRQSRERGQNESEDEGEGKTKAKGRANAVLPQNASVRELDAARHECAPCRCGRDETYV